MQPRNKLLHSRAVPLAGLLVLSAVLTGCAAYDTQPAPGPLAESAGRRDPIEYVAPELRAPLQATVERYAAMGFAGFNADNLAQMRQGIAAREPQWLAEPAVEERLIPGAAGHPDVRVYVIGAAPGASRPAIVHMHGGGFILGTAASAVPSMQALAVRHDSVVVTVDYRLAPETPFPGSLEDNYAALQWVHANAAQLGVDRSRIAIMGDSAGGGHAAMLAIAARDRGEVPLALQVLVYPMLDDRTGSTVEQPYWMGYGSWTPEANRFGWTSLLGVPAGSDAVPPGAVPAREENLAGLAPAFIVVGSVDLFADEDIEYAQRLVAAGVPTELHVLPGGYHGFQAASPDTGLAKRFNAAIDAALARALVQPPRSAAPGPAKGQ